MILERHNNSMEAFIINSNAPQTFTTPLQNYRTDDQVKKSITSKTETFTNIDPKIENWKQASLPLARVKKIMKDEGGGNTKFMIGAEVPLLFIKACELFIEELSVRAWACTLNCNRKTLAKIDLHTAANGSDVFDFLIDVVPRVEVAPYALDAEFTGNNINATKQQTKLKIADGEKPPPPNNRNNAAEFDAAGISMMQQIAALGFGSHVTPQQQQYLNTQTVMWQKYGELKMKERAGKLKEMQALEDEKRAREELTALQKCNEQGKANNRNKTNKVKAEEKQRAAKEMELEIEMAREELPGETQTQPQTTDSVII